MSVVIYEVNLWVDGDVAGGYRAWLAEHVAQMLAVPGFVDARVMDVREPAPAEGELALCVQYRVHGMAALQDYFDHHAVRMRAEGIARFGGRFRAARRVMVVD